MANRALDILEELALPSLGRFLDDSVQERPPDDRAHDWLAPHIPSRALAGSAPSVAVLQLDWTCGTNSGIADCRGRKKKFPP